MRLVYQPEGATPAGGYLADPILHEGRIRGCGEFDGLETGPETIQRFIAWMEKGVIL